MRLLSFLLLLVVQTAYQVGFESPQYFATVFKEFYASTPTEYSHRVKRSAPQEKPD